MEEEVEYENPRSEGKGQVRNDGAQFSQSSSEHLLFSGDDEPTEPFPPLPDEEILDVPLIS